MATASLPTGVGAVVALVQAVALLQGAGCPAARIVVQSSSLLAALDDVTWAAAEDELLAAGINRSLVAALADRRQRLPGFSAQPPHAAGDGTVPAGHPLDTLRRENAAIRRHAEELARLADARGPAVHSADEWPERLRRSVEALSEVRKHQDRVMNLLLPQIERRGLRGLTRTLWAYYAGVRNRLAAVQGLRVRSPAELRSAMEPIVSALLKSLHAGLFREEQVLAPLLMRLLTDEEWAQVWRDSPTFGWCLVAPGAQFAPAGECGDRPQESAAESAGGVSVGAGALSPRQLRGIFAVLPADLTFVDAGDAVRFFSESPDRIFPRTRSVLGRKVQNCHPPSSLRQVNRILSDFRDGRRSAAEFWFERRGRFLLVRYFAVRDEAGEYLGTLEVSQDLTPLRALHGEQRLLPEVTAAEGSA